MAHVSCVCCGKQDDVRSMQLCPDCNSYLCSDCFYQNGGVCNECRESQLNDGLPL